MSKHTPGPYHHDQPYMGNVTAEDIQTKYFNAVWPKDLGYALAFCREEVDARLFSAAPDMLEALERLTSIAKVLQKERVLQHPNELAVIRQAESAILKAKGE